jgi:hypothetical protein
MLEINKPLDNPEDRLLSTSRAAEYLGRSTYTLIDWRKKGGNGLDFVCVGNRYAYKMSDLNAFIEKSTRDKRR